MNKKIVTLVSITEGLSMNIPHIGEYENPAVKKIVPCVKDSAGRYTDLRTGTEVKKSKNTLEWLNLTGTVFRYADGVNILVTRRFADDSLLCLEIPDSDITDAMMPRCVFERIDKSA